MTWLTFIAAALSWTLFVWALRSPRCNEAVQIMILFLAAHFSAAWVHTVAGWQYDVVLLVVLVGALSYLAIATFRAYRQNARPDH